MKNRALLIILGILAIVAGFFAILYPFAGSVAVTLLAGWFFLVIGVVQVVAVFRETDWGSRLWSLLLAALAIIAGISLLANPLAGMISLTWLLAIVFLFSGAFKIAASLGLEGGNWRWLVLLSGLLSVLLGILILVDFPAVAAWMLGVLLGIQLISDGASMLGLAYAIQRMTRG